jgi:hypothetical protein
MKRNIQWRDSKQQKVENHHKTVAEAKHLKLEAHGVWERLEVFLNANGLKRAGGSQHFKPLSATAEEELRKMNYAPESPNELPSPTTFSTSRPFWQPSFTPPINFITGPGESDGTFPFLTQYSASSSTLGYILSLEPYHLGTVSFSTQFDSAWNMTASHGTAPSGLWLSTTKAQPSSGLLN